MKLIDLLVRELPKRGGWPEGVERLEQDSEGQFFEMESDYCSEFALQKCDSWIDDTVTKAQYEAALAASKPQWDGVWMPPAGCDFEYKSLSGIWVKAKMKFCGNSLSIVDVDGCEALLSIDIPMRPLKTEADNKREAEINELIDAINLTLTDIYASRIFMDAIRERRIPGVKLED